MGTVLGQITTKETNGAWFNYVSRDQALKDENLCETVYEVQGGDAFNACKDAYSKEEVGKAQMYETALKEGFVGDYKSWLAQKDSTWLKEATDLFKGWSSTVDVTETQDSSKPKVSNSKTSIIGVAVVGAAVIGFAIYKMAGKKK